jgi:hypothetical protein
MNPRYSQKIYIEMEKYFIFITPDNTIWGVGLSRTEAIQDSVVNIVNYGTTYQKGKVVPASYELAWAIWDNGYVEDMWEYDHTNGIAILKRKVIDYYSEIKSGREITLKY